MTDLSIYDATPRTARKWIKRALEAGLVPFVRSSPGLGKSSIVRSIGNEYNLELIDHRLSTSDPTDMSGLPFRVGQKSEFLPFDMFPLEGDPLPPGRDGWLLFFDEFNSAPKAVQAAAYKVVLDKMVGQKKLHPRVRIACAGNKASDRAIVNDLSTAMQSRIIHIDMVVSFDEWQQDVAIKFGYDDRVVAFLTANKEFLMDFKPNHNDRTFACPRTWEFVNDLCKKTPLEEMVEYTGLFAGTITAEVAASFVQFSQVFAHLPKLSQILRDPSGTPMPNDNSTRFATCLMLAQDVTENNFSQIDTYLKQFPSEMRVLFYRTVRIRHPKLISHQCFRTAIVELSKYLNSDN